MRKKLIPLIGVFFFYALNAHSLCIDEGRDLDSCLQCCTDTAQTAQVISNNPGLAKTLASLCQSNKGSESMEFKTFYAKYKIEGSTYFAACANPRFIKSSKYEAEPYIGCIETCKIKFKKGKK